jgi:hypothetical protein
VTEHDHPKEGQCLPACPAWAEGALELYALQRRHADMLAACQAAARVECVIVAPGQPGVDLPDSLKEQDSLIRLNTVVGRDCKELLLDEWGLRVELTFRGRRHACALPWGAVVGGLLVPPARPKPRFGVIQGGKRD